MRMTPGEWIAVIGAVSGLAIAWTGFLKVAAASRYATRDRPLRSAREEVEWLDRRLKITQERLDDEIASRRSDEERISALEEDRATDRARLTRLERLLSQAASYIEALLRWAHASGQRSIPPLPAELHEIVDPTLWLGHGEPKP